MADAEIGLTIVPALSFAQKAAAIGGTALAFIVLDALWLGWASRDLYSGTSGSIMVQPPRWDAAVLFYLVYLAGTLYFAVLPNAAIGIGWTALQGAALGALAYATYDLTNLATLHLEVGRDRYRLGHLRHGHRRRRRSGRRPRRLTARHAGLGWRPDRAGGAADAAVRARRDAGLAARGDRSPFDWGRVADDTPIGPVVDAVRAARAAGYRIVFCSGRSDECRLATHLWLDRNAGRIPSEPVLMRPAGDWRKDSIVKLELFDRHVRDSYNVRYVLDDRQQVVDAWRSIGLTVFQVAEGNF